MFRYLGTALLTIAVITPTAIHAGTEAVSARLAGQYFDQICVRQPNRKAREVAAKSAGLSASGSSLEHPTLALKVTLSQNSSGQERCLVEFATTDRKRQFSMGVATGNDVRIFDRGSDGGSLRIRGRGDDIFGIYSEPETARGLGWGAVMLFSPE